MATAELSAAVSLDDDPREAWRGRAFGVEIAAPFAIPEIRPADGPRAGFVTALEPASERELEAAWSRADAEAIIDRRFEDGRQMLRVERHPERGFLIEAPGHGTHLVSDGGARIQSFLPDVAPWRWQRLLFAQVIPLAAALRGVQVLHASAVALDGGAVAFLAPSGTGKTSVAGHLVAGGAALVTDDALALEATSDGVLVHPGAAMASLHRSELDSMTAGGRARLGKVLGASDKVHVAMPVAEEPLPLVGIYFLARKLRFRDLAIEATQADPTRVLGSAFVSYLRDPAHLFGHLDTCSRIVAGARAFEVRVPPTVPAAAVAEAIREHHGAVRSGSGA